MFRAALERIVLDPDRADELLITWRHVYQPTYTVLWAPPTGRIRPLFESSGHHYLLETVDLDGDGAEEILLHGLTNELGWCRTVVDLRLDSPIHSLDRATVQPARSPDLARPDAPALMWYALVPGGSCDRAVEDCYVIDEIRREIRIDGAEPWIIGFDGFPVSAASSLAPGERERARRAAYASLRSSIALQRAGEHEQAARALAL